MERKFTIETRHERLVLARWTALPTLQDVNDYKAAGMVAVEKCTSPAIVCADWRHAAVASQAVANVLLDLLVGSSPLIARAAILLARDNAMFNLQAERLVREARSAARRTFRDEQDMIAWLAEVCSRKEMVSMQAFLGL